MYLQFKLLIIIGIRVSQFTNFALERQRLYHYTQIESGVFLLSSAHSVIAKFSLGGMHIFWQNTKVLLNFNPHVENYKKGHFAGV